MLEILQILLYRASLQIDISSIIKKNNSNIYLLVVDAHQSHILPHQFIVLIYVIKFVILLIFSYM